MKFRLLAMAFSTAMLTLAPGVAAAAPPAAQAVAASPSTTLACTAVMTVPRPRQNSTTVVHITGLEARAAVSTLAHYRSTNTRHTAVAGVNRVANVPYLVSRATKGYKVVAQVTASLGTTRWACSTSFIPS